MVIILSNTVMISEKKHITVEYILYFLGLLQLEHHLVPLF